MCDSYLVTLAISATLMQTPERGCLDVRDVLVVVDGDGWVVGIHPKGSTAADADAAAADTHTVLPAGTVLLPGLVDLHVHAPQWPQLGTGLDLPLGDWLADYTFPLEARFDDFDFARTVWLDLVESLLAHGTTTAAYFSSRYLNATTELAATCHRAGQRAFVGRVAMDHPGETPPSYRDASAEAGVTLSARSIDEIRAIDPDGQLVRPIITPRFTPACTDALLEGLGELAKAVGVPVQTHCSESDWEHDHVLDRFGASDTTVLERFGLLTRGTILAHVTHADSNDLERIIESGAGVAHCPLSNAYFASAVFPTRRALDLGVPIGLGSDIAGGPSPSLLHQCHQAVTSSRMLEDGANPTRPVAERGVPRSRINILTAFWMATVGNARILDLPVGLIKVGYQFDAVAVDTTLTGSPLRVWEELDTPERVFEKVVRLAGPAEISAVWVNGRQVVDPPLPQTGSS